jgi:protein gp37
MKNHPETFPYGFTPTFHPSRLDKPLHVKKPSRIFVCSMGDLFDPLIKQEDFESVFDVMAAARHHRFLVLTKRPHLIKERLYESNYLGGGDYYEHIWLGTTIDRSGSESRIDVLRDVASDWHKFVSVEPLLEKLAPNFTDIESIMIGGQTGPEFIPPWEWVEIIVKEADRCGTKVFMKDNLHAPIDKIRVEFPEDLIPKEKKTTQLCLDIDNHTSA